MMCPMVVSGRTESVLFGSVVGDALPSGVVLCALWFLFPCLPRGVSVPLGSLVGWEAAYHRCMVVGAAPSSFL